MEKILSNMNGDLVEYKSQLALSPVTNSIEAGINNDAEGVDEFSFATGDDNSEFSLASGKKKKSKGKSKKGKRRGGFFQDTINRMQDRADVKQKRKIEEAKAQQIAAKGLAESTAGDIAMAQALAKSAPKDSGDKKGMSKGMKIGLIVGGVVVLGLVGFLIYKKMNSGKK